MNHEKPLTIGGVAKLVGVGIETIRFYERRGLLPEPPRKESGYRLYPSTTVHRILFIKQAKELGFTLAEINELLSLRVRRGTTCPDVKRRAEAKIAEVEGKIAQLQRIQNALRKLSRQCTGRGPASECPILEALSSSRRKT